MHKNLSHIIITIILIVLFKNINSQNIVINEFLTSNASVNIDPDYSTLCDWLELYNNDTIAHDLTGYFLTDDLSELTKWEIPNTVLQPGAHAIFWADGMNTGYHTNFRLSKEGESIGLSAPGNILIDSIVFSCQISDVSYGRKNDGDPEWVYFYEPSPNEPNNNSGVNEIHRASPPDFSISGGFYSGSVTLALSSLSPPATIKYTLDGSKPALSSEIYTGPVLIDTTTVIRATCYDTTGLPSFCVTHTYFINTDFNIPVISLSTNPDYMWDDVNGIYQNILMDKERPCNVEIFTENSTASINQETGVKLHGAFACDLPQKALSVTARNKYNKNYFDNNNIFRERDYDMIRSLIFRSGGWPDNFYTILRDGTMETMIQNNIDLEYMAYRPASLYINGKYWGIYNIREKQNAEYLYSLCNVPAENIDLLEYPWGGSIIEGENIQFKDLMYYINNNDMSLSSVFDHVRSRMDIDNYIDYLITEIYLANSDWPQINQKYWRPRNPDGKWRWILFDVEFGFGLISGYDHNTLSFALEENGPDWPNPPASTFLIRKVFENPEFKYEFIQRFACYLNKTFKPDRIINIIDSIKLIVEPEMPYHISRWKDSCYTADWGADYCGIGSMDFWYNEIDKMKEFALYRPDYIRQHIMNEFNVNNTISLTTNAVNGKIFISNVEIPSPSFTGTYFSYIPTNIVAIPNSGYKFSHWEGITGSASDSVNIVLTSDSSLTAVFIPTDESIIPSMITEDLILLSENSPYISTGDIIVDSFATLFAEPGVEIRMHDFSNFIVHGRLVFTGTENTPVIIRSNVSVGAENWGAICVQNATGTTELLHVKIYDATTGFDKTNFFAAVSAFNSNIVMDNVLIRGAPQPFFSQYGDSLIIKNSTLRSTKICDLINIKYANYALVENCDLKGNNAPDTDAIDYDDINGGIIRNNSIYGFQGFNSDGIDIGENASNIIIENNKIYNCLDKGVSVGQASSAIIKNNVFLNCLMGVGVKDSNSYALIDKNTFYTNGFAVACFEKNPGDGGGNAEIKNSILSNSYEDAIYLDDLSSIQISYSLSDNYNLSGEGNIYSYPLFVSPIIYNFELQSGSPCIDAGDPSSPYDPDGTVTDIGANFVFAQQVQESVVINEINYHSSEDFFSEDWIELYNNSNKTIDISGWVFRDDNDLNYYIFPEGAQLQPDEYLVLTRNKLLFKTVYPDVYNYRGNFDFGLNNNGENILLFDGQMNLVDMVPYKDEYPWPTEPDGTGPTLELKDPGLDNALASSWSASLNNGTPGEINSINIPVDPVEPENYLSQNYPNPFSTSTSISYNIKENAHVELVVYNSIGQAVKELVNDYHLPGKYTLIWSCENLQSGIYYYILNINGKHIEAKKAIKLK